MIEEMASDLAREIDRDTANEVTRRGERKMELRSYRNSSGQMVILRCIGPDSFFQEKVVFPFEQWLFACPNDTRLEVWTHGSAGLECIDALAAAELLLPLVSDTPEAAALAV